MFDNTNNEEPSFIETFIRSVYAKKAYNEGDTIGGYMSLAADKETFNAYVIFKTVKDMFSASNESSLNTVVEQPVSISADNEQASTTINQDDAAAGLVFAAYAGASLVTIIGTLVASSCL